MEWQLGVPCPLALYVQRGSSSLHKHQASLRSCRVAQVERRARHTQSPAAVGVGRAGAPSFPLQQPAPAAVGGGKHLAGGVAALVGLVVEVEDRSAPGALRVQ